MVLRINYLAFLNPYNHSGGGEVVLRSILDAGKKRGHSFAMTTVSPRSTEYLADADLTIVADYFNCPNHLSKPDANLLRRVIAGGRYVHFDNAYVDVCNLDYLPCSGRSQKNCSYKETLPFAQRLLRFDFSGTCSLGRELVQSLYKGSLCNIYVSPLHRQVISTMTASHKNDSFVLRPLIDGRRFFDAGKERDIEYLFVGHICEAKGLQEMKLRYNDKDIHFVGKLAKGEILDFGTYHGPVSYSEIPLFMNRAKNFVFLPRWPEPQGRVVVEAALCGCKLITNSNVGATSFSFDISCPEFSAGAAEELWQKLESI